MPVGLSIAGGAWAGEQLPIDGGPLLVVPEPEPSALVVAVTNEGRALRGVVDERTNDQALWLRRDSAQVSFSQAVSWSRVAVLELDGVRVDPAWFKKVWRAYATRRSVSDVWSLEGASGGGLGIAPKREASSEVVALRVAAGLSNWDSDALGDGLSLRVAPVDGRGRLSPVRGELRVRLLGVRQASRHRRRYAQLAQWSTSVRMGDFNDGVAVYSMPLPGLQPEVDTGIGTLARVEVRLGVFGSGAFAATTPVRLRAFDPLADELQLATGSRLFPGERLPAGRRPTPVGDGLFFSAPVGP